MSRPKIGIIGAGWAGLSAALSLHAQADVVVFEASKTAGGRARALNRHPSSGADADDASGSQYGSGLSALDNGQHLFLGAYQNLLTILRQVGVSESEAFLRLPFFWYMGDGIQLQCPKIAAPWHLLIGILRAKNFSIGEKLALLKNAQALKKFNDSDLSVNAWLWQQNVQPKEVANFWQPLVLAAMNTPLDLASTEVLSKVINDGVLKSRSGSDLLLPKKPLDELFVEPVCAYLKKHNVPIHLGKRIVSLESHGKNHILIDGAKFDAVIVATAPYHAAKLIVNEATQNILNQLQYAAITTVYLRYDQTVVLPYPMVGLAEGTAQWLFERGKLSGSPNEVAAVVSCADEYAHLEASELIGKVHQDLLRYCPYLTPPVASRVITEKRATFLSEVNRPRVDSSILAKQGIFLAGDYMHPTYPGTLEGAVVSGQIAAAQCLLSLID